MQTYIGTKVIKAKPMNRQQYNDLRGWTMPATENGGDEGYLVEYLDSPNANHADFENYISWSPKAVFEKAYKTTGKMSFGMAVDSAKLGYKVARKGWNGKDMWLAYHPGVSQLPAESFWNEHTKQFAIDNGGAADVQPYFVMKTAQGNIQMGWAPSQSDCLAEDWEVVS